MELEEMTRQIGAQGGVMKQLSVFMANGETRAIEALEYTLEAFIKSENWHDFEGEAIEALVKFMGERLSREDVDKRVVARFGFGLAIAAKRLLEEASTPQLELMTKFLFCIHDRERATIDPLAAMLSACELAKAPAAPVEVETEAPDDGGRQPKAPEGFRGGPLEWLELKYQELKKGVGTVRFTMNAYQDGYSDYGVDIDAETFEEIMATRRKVTDAKEPAASLANLAETLQAAEDDVDRQAEESIRVDVDGLRKEFARLSETEGARLQALLGVWDGTETGAEMLLSEVEFHTVLAVLKDMRRGKKILSVLATPDLALEDLQEAHRALEFRGHKMQPGAGYDPEDLLRMDGDGDEIWSEESVHVGVETSVSVYVMDEVKPAEAVRLLRKIAAAIEKTGLPRDKRVTYTDHPILEHTEAIKGRMRQQKPAPVGDPALADEAVAAFKRFSDSVRPSMQ